MRRKTDFKLMMWHKVLFNNCIGCVLSIELTLFYSSALLVSFLYIFVSVLQACCPECGEVYSEGETFNQSKTLMFCLAQHERGPEERLCFIPCKQCKPEYKVPGLYVIDSIVRQSRHQFGAEKDVFAPRFSKNIIATFQHLYRCPSDDKVRPFWGER